MDSNTPVTQPSYQYEIEFFGDYDSTVLDSLNIPDAMDTEFRNQVNGKVQQIKMIFSFQRGINKMSVKLEYNNIVYLITLHRQ